MAILKGRVDSGKMKLSHLSWSAVIAGTIVGLMIQVTLLLLGAAVGLYSAGPTGGMSGIGVGAAFWWIASAVVSLFLGGWLSSRFAGLQRVFDGILHGIVTWSLVTVLTLTVLTNLIGGIPAGAFSMVGGQALGAGESAADAVGGAALASFLALLFGAASAGFGGWLGRVRRKVRS